MLHRLSAMNQSFQRWSFETFLREISHIGFRKIDLWTSPHHFLVDHYQHDDTDALKKKLREYSLEVSCLTPRQSCPQPYHLASKNEMISDSKKYFQQIVYSAHELEIPRILVTSGWSFEDESLEEAWERSILFCQWLASFSESYGIKIALEPLTKQSSRLVYSLESMKSYVEQVGHSNLTIAVDTGTIIRRGETVSEYFKVFGEKIDYCHLTSYRRDQFAHVAWQDGELPLSKILEEFLKYDYRGDFCLEYTASQYQKKPVEIYLESYNYIKKLEGAKW